MEDTATTSGSSSSSNCLVCFETIRRSDRLTTADPMTVNNDHDRDHHTESNTVTMSVQLTCGHVTCDSCWRGIVKASVEGLGVQRICCPAAGCGALLPLDDVEALVTPEVGKVFHEVCILLYLMCETGII
eukprot:GHUV01052300.1.p1 GENE.GHUV01052300.1~~GHUV01052300.1.p1  ORF type:complete len:144 (+),score=29.66 GHUV01052300.1:45-434(+)